MEEQVNQLRRQIDLITGQATACMSQGDYLKANELLTERFNMIKQLVNLAGTGNADVALKNYLSELFQRDQEIIRRLDQDKTALKSIVANLHKIKEYTSSF